MAEDIKAYEAAANQPTPNGAAKPEDLGPWCIECGIHMNGGKPAMGATLHKDCWYCEQRAAGVTILLRKRP